jgi:hypothetical protein
MNNMTVKCKYRSKEDPNICGCEKERKCNYAPKFQDCPFFKLMAKIEELQAEVEERDAYKCPDCEKPFERVMADEYTVFCDCGSAWRVDRKDYASCEIIPLETWERNGKRFPEVYNYQEVRRLKEKIKALKKDRGCAYCKHDKKKPNENPCNQCNFNSGDGDCWEEKEDEE